MALEKELETYHREHARLMEHAGKFVVIHGTEVVGFWDTYEDALRAAYAKFGLEPFMVKKVSAVEQVQYFTRDIGLPCPT